MRTTYKPNESINVVFYSNLRHEKSDQSDVNHDQHNRSYAIDSNLALSDRWSADLSYSFNDLFSRTDICFVSVPALTTQAAFCGVPYQFGISSYKGNTHYGAFDVRFRPLRRVQANVGYTITATQGSTLLLNPLVSEHWTWKAGWNYFNYSEDSVTGPTASRNFRGNVATISLRYSTYE